MDRKQIALAVAAGAFAWALWLVWLWQPERQVRLHQKEFLQVVERRDARRLEKLLAPGYRDCWGQDRATMIDGCERIFGHFLFLTVDHRIEDCTVDGRMGIVRAPVKLRGTGSPIAEQAMTAVNALRQPFVFVWEKRSAAPWDWQLTRIEQPELQLQQPVLMAQ